MYRVRQEELPFVGSSHEFVGAEQRDYIAGLKIKQGVSKDALFEGNPPVSGD